MTGSGGLRSPGRKAAGRCLSGGARFGPHGRLVMRRALRFAFGPTTYLPWLRPALEAKGLKVAGGSPLWPRSLRLRS